LQKRKTLVQWYKISETKGHFKRKEKVKVIFFQFNAAKKLKKRGHVWSKE